MKGEDGESSFYCIFNFQKCFMKLFINPIRIIRKIISIEETKEMMCEILETFPGKI